MQRDRCKEKEVERQLYRGRGRETVVKRQMQRHRCKETEVERKAAGQKKINRYGKRKLDRDGK